MADNDPASSRSLADQAMSNLVNQFARPMDFLRELVQNSIDAGTPRIDVYLQWAPPAAGDTQGVLQIHVDDYGEGMDENIVDNQLTRLFSSTKEDDLTKIGKFGIGFTSIFAIRPDLVQLLTGKHGESWELVFHTDRSYEKRRHEEPVSGTKITLFKRLDPAEMDRTVQEARFILTYWCEHSNIPITFDDRTGAKAAPSPAGDAELDPFAAFMEAAGADSDDPGASDTAVTINRPLSMIGADVEVSVRTDEIHAVAAYTERPRYGYFNGGLTLISSEHVDVLGAYASQLSHIAFKVKFDGLEHTLTRDNVLQDANWETAMGAVIEAWHSLRTRLLHKAGDAQLDALGVLHQHLATETRLAGGVGGVSDWWPADLPVFRNFDGTPLSRKQVEQQESELGAVLLDPGPGPLRDAVAAQEHHMLYTSPGTHELLLALGRTSLLPWARTDRQLVRADRYFVLPELRDLLGLPSAERMLIEATQKLLDAVTHGRMTLLVGDFGGRRVATEEPLALERDQDATLFQRPTDPWFRRQLPSFLRWRTLLVNRHHAHFQAQVVAAAEDLDLAAVALAQALMMTEDIESDAAYDTLMGAAL